MTTIINSIFFLLEDFGSWDSLNEGDFIEEKPIVKFSSPVDLIKPLKSEDYETPINIDLEEEIEDDDRI